MNDKKSKKSSFFSVKDFRIKDLCYIIFIFVSLFIAVSNYCYIRREGHIKIFVPSRYGTVSGTHQHNTSDKVLLCFVLHNNGNLFRNIGSINLKLTDENESQWNFKAIVKIDKLKELNFKEHSLKYNPNYSLVTSISIDKNQFVSPNLLFYYEDDKGWSGGEKVFNLKEGATYTGKITITSLKSDVNGYQDVSYESDYFNFTVRYEPFENMIDTFTDINIGELKLNKLKEK